MIIGLSGKMYSGKDTACSCIKSLYPDIYWQQVSFAYRLKAMVALLTNTTMEENLSEQGKQIIPNGFADSLGALQQKMGMALRNEIDPNVWVNAAFTTIKPGDYAIITDVRFPNEVEAIKSRGGIVIRLEGDPSRKRDTDKRDQQHPSETSLDGCKDFDVIIQNTGSVNDLRNKLKDFLRIYFE